MRKYLPLLCFIFSSCMVGPRYHTPETIVTDAFIENKPGEMKEITDADLLNWWTIFEDPFLNELLSTAIGENFDFRIALEQVAQARAYYWTQFAEILPELDIEGLASQSRSNRGTDSIASAGPLTQSFYNIGLDAIWEIDLFGRLRHTANAAHDLLEASIEEVRAVKITVVSEVVNTYATICALQKKLSIMQQLIKIDEELLRLTRIRSDAGLSGAGAVDRAIATLTGDQALLTLLDTSLKRTIYSLSVLLGQLPEVVMQKFTIERPLLTTSEKVPTSLPSELLRRRPDINIAERQLAAATEEIGVAVAAMFPRVTLTNGPLAFNALQGAGVGFSSNQLGQLFNKNSFVYGVGGLVTMPVWDFGKRKAAIDVQVALKQQAYYNYQKTVITALQETEQALITYFNEEKRKEDRIQQLEANSKLLALSTDRFEAGLVDYTEVLTNEQTYLNSESTLIDSKLALTTSLIALYKALGGEW